MSHNTPHVRRSAPRSSKKSTFIALGAVGAVAASVLACCVFSMEEEEVTADCVERSDYSSNGYRVVDDDECDDSRSRGSYFWYYGGANSGGRVSGGSSVKPKGVKITTRNGKTLQKGGFGSRFSGGGG